MVDCDDVWHNPAAEELILDAIYYQSGRKHNPMYDELFADLNAARLKDEIARFGEGFSRDNHAEQEAYWIDLRERGHREKFELAIAKRPDLINRAIPVRRERWGWDPVLVKDRIPPLVHHCQDMRWDCARKLLEAGASVMLGYSERLGARYWVAADYAFAWDAQATWPKDADQRVVCETLVRRNAVDFQVNQRASLFEQNVAAARAAALVIVGMRKFRRGASSALAASSKDIAVMIGKMIASTHPWEWKARHDSLALVTRFAVARKKYKPQKKK